MEGIKGKGPGTMWLLGNLHTRGSKVRTLIKEGRGAGAGVIVPTDS